jgi:hypothetical protein
MTDTWETCRIVDVQFLAAGMVGEHRWSTLRAQAIGPQGTYIAGESYMYYRKFDDHISDRELFSGRELAYSFLANRLVKDGWEATSLGTGAQWWESEFRRRSGKDNPLPWTTWEVEISWTKNKKGAFRLLRRATEKPYDPEFGPTSREFDGTGFLRGDIRSERHERVQILSEFLHGLQSEGYELLSPSDTEHVKESRMIRNKDLIKVWYLNVLIRRDKTLFGQS